MSFQFCGSIVFSLIRPGMFGYANVLLTKYEDFINLVRVIRLQQKFCKIPKATGRQTTSSTLTTIMH